MGRFTSAATSVYKSPETRLALARLYKFKPPGIFDWGTPARLPEAYKKFYKEWNDVPEPVHFIPEPGKYKKNENTSVVTPVQNVPLPLRFPNEFHKMLTGGEQVVQGFTKKPMKRRVPKFWIPCLRRSVVYSEVLDKHINCIIAPRLIFQIHEHGTLDMYLLKSRACDLKSLLALKIKRKILETLQSNQLPYDERKNKEIYEKYKDFLMPAEELEWFGLSLTEACAKLVELENEEKIKNKIPLKHFYRKQLIEELQSAGIKEAIDVPKQSSGWLSKIKSPFTSSTTNSTTATN